MTIVYPEELLAARVKELEAEKALMVQTFGNIMDDRALAYAGLSLEKLVAENERLRGLLVEALQAMNLEGVCEPNCMACGDILAALARKAEQ